jgi:CheY-like chemotaxis protein
MKKILIVDDKAEIRKLLAITLGLEYEVLLANSGEEAVLMVESYRPAVVLMDVMMPGTLDGFAALEKIKSNPENTNILVVMITAKGDSVDLKTGDMLGADAYFVKPFSPLKLVTWLHDRLLLDK